MYKSLRSAACLAVLACSAALASAAPVAFGSTSNTSNTFGSFDLSGSGDETFSIDFAAGNYVLDLATVVHDSLYGKIDHVSFGGQSFDALVHGQSYDLVNYAFTVPTGGEVLSFVINTSTTPEHYFVTETHGHKVTQQERVRQTFPNYMGMALFTDVGTPVVSTPEVSPVPEPANGALMLSGLLGLGFLAARRKAIKA